MPADRPLIWSRAVLVTAAELAVMAGLVFLHGQLYTAHYPGPVSLAAILIFVSVRLTFRPLYRGWCRRRARAAAGQENTP